MLGSVGFSRISSKENVEMANIMDVTDGTFEAEVLKSALPVMVDFWAPWCGPCMMMGPVVEALAVKLSGKVKFVKLNTDENPQTGQRYKITAIPTLIVFKSGAEADRLIGVKPQQQLEKQLQGHILPSSPPDPAKGS
jgi:thioredoxin